MRSRRKRESRKRQSAGEDTAGCGNGSSTCQYLVMRPVGRSTPSAACVFPFSLPTLTAEVKPRRYVRKTAEKHGRAGSRRLFADFFAAGGFNASAIAGGAGLFEGLAGLLLLASLRETAPRMFHTRYDLSSRRKASSRSLRAPAVFPCWSRQIPRERYAPRKVRAGWPSSDHRRRRRRTRAGSGPARGGSAPVGNRARFSVLRQGIPALFPGRYTSRLSKGHVLLRKAVRPAGHACPTRPWGWRAWEASFPAPAANSRAARGWTTGPALPQSPGIGQD